MVTVLSAALVGVNAVPIAVEVDLLRRLPRVCIVGLADHAVKESAECVRSAIESAGFEFPKKRIVVNLVAPSNSTALPVGANAGTGVDLPIALGILFGEGWVPERKALFLGELSIAGTLRPIRGAVAYAELARSMGLPLILPKASEVEASLVEGVEVIGVQTLREAVDWVRGLFTASYTEPEPQPEANYWRVDMSEVHGQERARRAMLIAAAGGHSLLLIGPPGCGKSMLARRMSTLLPPMTKQEVIEVARVHSVAGRLSDPFPPPAGLLGRPFRAPHHSITPAGLIGDKSGRPGEISLAHHGVLFLDDAPEFSRTNLELLREPLREGEVTATRASGTLRYPARIQLVLAADPCPCGRKGTERVCNCTEASILSYRRRLDPLLRDVDLAVELQPLRSPLPPAGPSSAEMREQVIAAKTFAHEDRDFAMLFGFSSTKASTKDLSGRDLNSITRVARTIANLEGSEPIRAVHIEEALSFFPAWRR